MAKVLVGITTRNRPLLVRETVRSVLAQTEGDFRLIVSENPSTPEAAQQVRDWIEALGDPRVSHVVQALDGGEYGQGRYLFGQCREPYLCLLHDDDLMEPTYLARALQALDSEPECCLFGSSQHVITADGRPDPVQTEAYAKMLARDRHRAGRMDNALEVELATGLFSISGVVLRTAMIRQRGLVDPDLGGLFPFEFNVFVRALETGRPAYYTPERLIAYRWHSASMRHTDGATLTRFMVEPLVHLLAQRRYSGQAERLRRRLLSYNLRNLGCIELVAGRRSQALHQIGLALRQNPFGPSIWAWGAAMLFAPGWMRRQFQARVNLAPPSPSWAAAIPKVESTPAV